MKRRIAYGEPLPVQFGVEQVYANGGVNLQSVLYVDLHREIYRRAIDKLSQGSFDRHVRDGVYSYPKMEHSRIRLRFLGSLPTTTGRRPTYEERTKGVARFLNLLHSVTRGPEKDPLVQPLMADVQKKDSPVPLYAMRVGLKLPKDLELQTAARVATRHMQSVANAIHYVPRLTPMEVVHSNNQLIAVQVGDRPRRGLLAQGWSDAGEPGFTATTMTDNHLASHVQQYVALAGVLGVVQAVRDQVQA